MMYSTQMSKIKRFPLGIFRLFPFGNLLGNNTKTSSEKFKEKVRNVWQLFAGDVI